MSVPQDWTEDDIARCRKLWDDGRSVSEIARELGRSRNSILGFTHRNRELFRRRGKRALASRSDRGKEPKLIRRVRTTVPPKPMVEPDVLVDAEPIELPQPAEPVTIVDLTSRTCRWPLWSVNDNPGAAGLYCGAGIDPNALYCRHHWARARA